MPHKRWSPGEEMVDTDFNPNVADQIVATYPDAPARAAAWTAPPVGAVSHLADSPGNLWIWNGSAWRAYASTGVLFYAASLTATNIPVAPGTIDLPGLVGTVTVPGSRKIRVSAVCQFGLAAGQTAGQAFLVLTDGSNNGLGGLNQMGTFLLAATIATTTVDVVITPAAGALTAKARAFSNTAGASAIYAQAMHFQIEDVGPA